VRGRENIPASGPYLLTTNHYSRRGFSAWWFVLALSAILPEEIHWITTAAWIFPRKIYDTPVRWLTSWFLRNQAQVYGFFTMTPIEPYSSEVEGRARSVRRVLDYVRHTPAPIIGLAPEGTNHTGAVLGPPPSGSGRFIARLAPACQEILPVGVFEDDDQLYLQFGAPYRLELPVDLSPEQRDPFVSQTVMHHIALQLPIKLRGNYT